MASLDDPICPTEIVRLLLYHFLIEDPLTDFLIQDRTFNNINLSHKRDQIKSTHRKNWIHMRV